MIYPASVAVTGTGSYLPSRVMLNDEFCSTIDTSDEWIRTRTGIRARRYAGPHENSATLGIEAARIAIDSAGLQPHDIDLIICATVTPHMMTPSNACLIQTGLGCRPVGAFDIGAACTGFLYALSVGEQFVRTGTCQHVLVVGAETLSRVADFTDRNTCILFGDGAGAVVLSASDQSNHGLRFVRLYSDGTKSELISLPSMVTTAPIAPSVPLPRRPEFLRLSGREVFRFAVHRMTELIDDAMIECQKIGCEIDLLIPHQVNQRIIDAALEQCEFPASKVMVNLDRYGNTSAASIPIALDEALRSGRAKRGDTMLFVAFGGGLTWGGAVVTL